MTGDLAAGLGAPAEGLGDGAPILEVVDLQAGYEDVVILDGVSIQVPNGSIVSIVGPNGAGKSTLVKAIYGLASVRAGRVIYRPDGQEHDVTHWKPYQLTAAGLNYVPQVDNIFPTMSVSENLRIGAITGGTRELAEAPLDQVFATFPFLREVRDRPAGFLSGGERQMLAIGRALMSQPRLLFLDEPSAGLAPQVVDELFTRLRQIHDTGVAIVMVEQNARRALAMSDYGYVLETGRNRYEGAGAALLEDDKVIELYLGRRREAGAVRSSTGQKGPSVLES
jgi:ABC-type branched-subunit amino acid transport system ATPase component